MMQGGLSAAIAASMSNKPSSASEHTKKAFKTSTTTNPKDQSARTFENQPAKTLENQPAKTFTTSQQGGGQSAAKASLTADNHKSESTARHQALDNTEAHRAERTNSDHATAATTTLSKKPLSAAAQAFDKKVSQIDAGIAEVRRRMDAVKDGLAEDPSFSAGNKSHAERAERDAVFSQFKALRAQQTALIDRKKALQSDLSAAIETLKKRGAEVNAARDKLAYKSPAEITRRIAELEQDLERNAYKLIQERAILQEVSKLKKAKKELEALDTAGSDSLNGQRARLDVIRAKLAGLDAELNALKPAIDTCLADIRRLDGLKEEAKARGQERSKRLDVLRAELDNLYAKRKAAFAERAAERTAQQAAYARQQARREEQKRLDAIQDQIDDLEKQLSRLATPSASSEADRRWAECTNLEAYFGPFAKQQTSPNNNAPSGTETKKADSSSSTTVAKVEGEVLKSKGERDAEFVFMGAKVQPAGTKKHHQSASGKSSGHTAEILPSKLPMAILGALADFGMTPPQDIASVKTLLMALDAKKSSLAAARAQSQATREAKQAELMTRIQVLRVQLEDPSAVIKAADLKKLDSQNKKEDNDGNALKIDGIKATSTDELAPQN